MGQYYTPVIRSSDGDMQKLYSHDYDNGLKLMEHSYLANEFVNAVLFTMEDICKEMDYVRLYWMGDYADDVIPKDDKEKMAAYRYSRNEKKPYYKFVLTEDVMTTVGWLVQNLDKHVVLNIPSFSYGYCTINVLPLLTNCGNGLGGGDFEGVLKLDDEVISVNDIGPWAGDRLNVIGIHSNTYDEVELAWDCIKRNDPEVKHFYPEIYVKEEL